MIAMLGCSKINIEVSDYSIKTVGFSEYREVNIERCQIIMKLLIEC